MLAISAVSLTAHAQQSFPLPRIVQERIDEETVLLMRIDLKKPGIAAVSKALSEFPDPFGSIGNRAVQCDVALQKLIELKVGEVFAIVSTSHLLFNGATIVVPSEGDETDRKAIFEALKTAWPEDVKLVQTGIVAGEIPSNTSNSATKRVERTEFGIALGAAKDSPVQIAVSPGPDARRVIREFLPVVPQELGAASGAILADGWQWLSLGLTPSPDLEIQFTAQAKDETSAEALAKTFVAVIDLAAQSEPIKAIGAKHQDVVSLLTPVRKENRVVLTLTAANGGSKRFMDQLGSPLLTQMKNDSNRWQTINNLKFLMLAMHNYHETHKAFPAQASRSADGKKLLSWRVHLLPFLDAGALYREFHLDEPWDSEHNQKLIAKMPEIYASPSLTREQRKSGMTTYLGLLADKTLFASPEGVSLKKILDGTSNTIAIVDANANTAVLWTKPDDLQIDLKQPLKDLTGQPGGMFRAALCDGSVRGIPDKIDTELFRRLIQIDDGEAVEEF